MNNTEKKKKDSNFLIKPDMETVEYWKVMAVENISKRRRQ